MKLLQSVKFRIKGEAVFWFVSIFFILTGILFSYGISAIININKENCTRKTTAVIIEFVQTEKNYFYPVYEFKDSSGKTIKKKSASGSSLNLQKKGQTVEIFYDPVNPDNFHVPGENYEMLALFKITGYIFFILGAFIFILTLPSLFIKFFYPQNSDYWFWWVNFTGGMVGALIFSVPSAFIWVIYYFLPEDIRISFSGKSFLLWIFTVVGIFVNIGLFFIAKAQLKGRPVWKK